MGLPSFLARPFATLPSRIVTAVFLATLGTCLILTWISLRTIGSFFHREIDRKYPALLVESRDRLEAWYAQRELDLETFGESRVLFEGLADLRAGGPERAQRRLREQLGAALRHELERHRQLESLFALAPDGSVLLWAGRRGTLPLPLRRELAAVADPVVSPLLRLRDRRVQFVSAPMGDPSAGLSLHGAIRLAEVARLLRNEDLGRYATIFAVDPVGRVAVSRDPARSRAGPLPPVSAARPVADYRRADGTRVVGSTLRYDRFDWTLVVEDDFEATVAPLVAVIREILALNLVIVGALSVATFLIARSMVRPIQALSDGALRIASGDSDVMIPGRMRNDEIGVLTRAFNEMAVRLRVNQEELEQKRGEIEDANHRLVSKNEELQRINDVFEQLSITDDLTRLHNHRFFQDHLPREMRRADRTGEPLSLVLIDIDDFKQLNDRHGHSVGDAVLRRVAEVMNGEVREMDLLARYGGEEFVLLASRTTLDGAATLAEKLRTAVSEARIEVLALDGPDAVGVTISAGVSSYRGDEKEFFNAADRALYRAKEAGKDCVWLSRDGALEPAA
jgi:diguanylate cyclase (GGDEF)-like protein